MLTYIQTELKVVIDSKLHFIECKFAKANYLFK
jgi:hypothetical protein